MTLASDPSITGMGCSFRMDRLRATAAARVADGGGPCKRHLLLLNQTRYLRDCRRTARSRIIEEESKAGCDRPSFN